MEDQEKALNLANLCNSNAINGYSGAGANAVSRADTVFLTTPLSEVVWSPRRGLSIKCADSCLIEKKAPVLWSTDIFNIIVGPPPATDDGKSDSSKLMTGEDSPQTCFQTCSKDNIHNEIDPLRSPPNSISMMHGSPMWSHEQSPGIFQGVKTMKAKPPMDAKGGDSPLEDEEEGTPSPRKKQPIANNVWESDDVNSEGPEYERTTEFISYKPEGVTSNLANVNAEYKKSDEESSQEHIKGDLEANNVPGVGKDEALVCDAPMFNKWNCPEDMARNTIFKDGKQEQPEDIAHEECHNGVIPSFTHLCPLDENSAQTSDLKGALCRQYSSFLMEHKRDCHNQAMVLTSEPSNKRKEGIYPVRHMEKTTSIQSPLNAIVKPLDQCKGKEKLSTAKITKSVSKKKEDSYESVKSSNNAEPFVTGKRAWSMVEGIFMESKRMKRSNNEDSCSGSHVKEDSSFINWISGVTKGFFGYDLVETNSLVPVPNLLSGKQRGLFSTPMSNDNNSDTASKNVGFGSTLKGFYLSRSIGKSNKTANVTHLAEFTNSKELQLENLTMRRNTNRINPDNEGIKLLNPVPTSSVQIMDQGASQFRELPPVFPYSVNKSHIQEKAKHNVQEHYDSVGSSSSSLPNGSSSLSEGKETGKAGSFILNKSSNLSIMNKESRIPASVWITRFSPKVAAPVEYNTQCNQDTFIESEKQNDECNMLLHHAQNDIDAVRDCQNSDDCCHSPLEDQKCIEYLQQSSISPIGLCCSRKGHTDLKTKFNLIPILPSQKLKKIEPITSVFAKRLDAFRHIQTSEIGDDTVPENATCCFCGKNGHLITSCSEVTECELKHLLKNINSLARAEKSVCLCIRCFQHNHWAVMCPYASLSSHQHVKNNASMGKCENQNFFRTFKGRSDATLPSDHARICEKVEDQQPQILSAHSVLCRDMSRNVTGFMLETSGNVDMNSTVKGKQVASISGEAELGDRSWAHLHNLVTMKKPDEQKRIFERVRMLRLSRTDVIRWMESSNSHFSLEGFFLRVRLGKWEEGQGEACYHVACINGALREKVYGGGRSRLPVNIGGSKCLIDCRFISNHDFVEDELKAWWTETLQRSGRLPSEVDLDKKLREREALDL